MKTSFFTPQNLAQESGLSVWTVTRFLRATFPERGPKTWWRLDEATYKNTLQSLRECQQQCPKQPLHALANNRGEIALNSR